MRAETTKRKGQSVFWAKVRANLWCICVPSQSVYVESCRMAGDLTFTTTLVGTTTRAMHDGSLKVVRTYYERNAMETDND